MNVAESLRDPEAFAAGHCVVESSNDPTKNKLLSPFNDHSKAADISPNSATDDGLLPTTRWRAFLHTIYPSLRLAPATVLVALCFGMFGPFMTELIKHRVCEVKLNYSDVICANINDAEYSALATEVKKETAEYNLWTDLIAGVPPMIIAPFVGSWSDVFGRKLPMAIPLFGMGASAVYLSVIANYQLHPDLILFQPVIPALTGAHGIMLMAMFSYMCDYSTEKTRSINFAVFEGIMGISGSLGSVIGGKVYQYWDHAAPFYLSSVLFMAAGLYCLFFIGDHVQSDKMAEKTCSSLFSWENFRDSVETLRKKRTGNTRGHIWLLMLCFVLAVTVTLADVNVLQLVLEFQPFNWTVVKYAVFSGISGATASVAMIVTMWFFRQYLGLPDTITGIIATVSVFLYYLGFGLAWLDWMVYVAATLGVFRNMVVPCIRSYLCGLVAHSENGKLLSFMSVLTSFTPLAGSAIFNMLYAQTNNWIPGLCMIVAAAMMVPVGLGLVYVQIVRKKVAYTVDETDFILPTDFVTKV